MLARFLLTCPPRKPRRFTKDEIPDDIIREVDGIFVGLYDLLQPDVAGDGNPKAVLATMNGDAEAEFAGFVNRHGQELMDLTGDLAAVWSKFEEVPARLALVIHYARRAAGATGLAGPEIVDGDTMRAAIRLTEWFKGETRRVYGLLGESEDDAAARRLVEWIEARGGAMTARDVQRGHRRYKTTDDAESALNELAEAGLGRWETVPPTAKGGRPSSRFVLSDLHAVDTSANDKIPSKPEENEGCVSVDSVNASENEVSEPDEWGEV